MFDRPGSSAAKPNAVLVGLDFGDDDYVESLAELQMLAATSGAQARELVRGKRDRPDPALYAGVVKERDDGIVISGAQQLATGGAMCDYIHLSCIHPLQPGDENYANCVAIPVNAPGVKLYPRRPYALQATNSFDYPLSSRFDETDAYVVFDKVFVPWEHVFIYRNIEISRDQWWKTPSHLYGNLQAQARYATKLRFMLGLAQRMNEMTGNIAQPPVQIMMGELAAIASIYENMLLAHEANATIVDGVLWPSKLALYSVMALQSELNGRMLEMIRELAGGTFFTVPSSVKDFENPETAADIERYMQSASTDARSRIAVIRLLWDFIGSDFGGRHQQYEKFYGGAHNDLMEGVVIFLSAVLMFYVSGWLFMKQEHIQVFAVGHINLVPKKILA